MTKLFDNKRVLIPIMSGLIFSSTTIGVQRTILSPYLNTFSEFNQFILIGSAIALASFGFSKAIGNYLGGFFSARGRKRSAIIGSFSLVLGSILLVFSSSYYHFFVGNALVGLGIGIFFASSAVSLTDIFPASKRGMAISLMELSVYAGSAFGAFLAGLVGISNIPFMLALGIASITIFTSLFAGESRYLQKDEELEFNSFREKYQGLSITKKVDIFSMDILLDKTPLPTEDRIQQKKISTPPPYGRRIMQPSLLVLFSIGMVSRIADSAVILGFPLILLALGYETFEIGIITSLFTISWAFGIIITGFLSDRIGRKFPIFMGLLLEGLGYFLMFFMDLQGWFPALVLGSIIAGLGRGIYFPIPASTSTELVAVKDKARILGLYRFLLDFGYVIGSIFLVIIVDFTKEIASIQPAFAIVILLLVLISLLTVPLLKDPKPGFKQLIATQDHLQLISNSISYAVDSILEIEKNAEESKLALATAKKFEQKADVLLDDMVKTTYTGGWKATDDLEIVQMSNKIDKVAGYILRGIRKLHLIDSSLSSNFHKLLANYAILLKTMVDTAAEVLILMNIRIDKAGEHTYQVRIVEEVLDKIHRLFWDEIKKSADKISPFSLILVIEAIESFEKGANTLEDAIDIIRVLSFKHQLY